MSADHRRQSRRSCAPAASDNRAPMRSAEGRERGSGRCQMQKLSAEKFHEFPPASSRKARLDAQYVNDKDGTPADSTSAAHGNDRDFGTSCRQLPDQITPVASRREEGVECRFLALFGQTGRVRVCRPLGNSRQTLNAPRRFEIRHRLLTARRIASISGYCGTRAVIAQSYGCPCGACG